MTRTPEELAYDAGHGRLDPADWPNPGDEVLYHHPVDGRWYPAEVVHVAKHDGDLCLEMPDGFTALDVKHGDHGHGWLLYREAAEISRLEAAVYKAECNPAPISTEEGTKDRG